MNSWRDHRVVDLAATDVNRVTIKNAGGEIELQRDGTHWKIAKPLVRPRRRREDQRPRFPGDESDRAKFVADDKADAAVLRAWPNRAAC